MGILFIVVLQITKPDIGNKWYLFTFCSLVILAFVLTELGNKAAYTGYRGWRIIWELSLKPLLSSKRRKRNEPIPNTNAVAQVIDGDIRHEHITAEQLEIESSSQSNDEKGLWEEEQKKRWEEWIQEEMHRLNGDTSLDESK